MNRRKLVILILMMTCGYVFVGSSPSTSAWALDREAPYSIDMVKTARDFNGLLVQLEVPPSSHNVSRGSGFWLDDRGYVGTCWHVVAENPTADILVKSASGRYSNVSKKVPVSASWTIFKAKVIAKDEVNDVALLKVDVPLGAPRTVLSQAAAIEHSSNYRRAPLGTELPKAGEKIILAGYPFGTPQPVVQQGLVASVNKLPSFDNTTKILVSLEANPGNSGGPVLNSNGEIIGLLQARISSRPNHDRAQSQSGKAVVVPISHVSRLLESLDR